MLKKGNNIFRLLIIILSIFMTSSINIVKADDGTGTTAPKDWGSQLVTKVQLQNADGQPQQSFGQYEDIKAYWEFSTPTGGVNKGDTMTFDVPEQLTITGDRNNVPVNEIPSGKRIGTASLSKSTRKVTVVFDQDYAVAKSKHDPVVGSVNVGTHWDTTKVTENSKVPLNWNITGSATSNTDSTISSAVSPGQKLDPDELLNKNGSFVGDQGNTILWTVRVNYKGENINDAIYKDTIGPHQTLLNDTDHPITTYSATPDYAEGTLTKDSDNKFANIKPTDINNDGFSVNFGDLTQPAIIEYYTTIDNTDDKSDSYANTGDLLSSKNELQNVSVNQAYTTLGSSARTGDQITSVMGHKLWQVLPDTKLPDSVTINLIQNGNTATPYAQQTVTADSNWSYVFNNLPKYDDNGNEYKYTVQEAPVDGFTSVTDPTNYDITNISNSIKRDMKVNKVWIDNNNPNRPSKIVVNLVDDNHNPVSKVDPNIDQITLDNSNNWSGVFKNVPVSPTGHWYFTEGTVTENGSWVDIPSDYFSVQKYNNSDQTDVTIYNKLSTSLTVTKKWQDDNSSKRPSEVKVQLYANDDNKGDQPIGDPVTLNEDNHWSHKFGAQLDEDPTKPSDPTNKLPKYDENNKEIKYSAKEVTVPTGYIEKDVVNTDGTDETITNTLDNPDVKTTSFKVTKNWADSDTVKSHPDIKVQLLANGNPTGDPITLSDKTSWTYTWDNLSQTDTDGSITYSVQEINVNGYTPAITYNDNKTEATITNTPVSKGTTSLSVNKVWNDNNNQDKLRPNSVSVQLLANGKDQGDPITLNADNNWHYEFTGLDKTVDYTLSEKAVDHYSSDIKNNGDNTFTITNTHTTKPVDNKTQVNVNKVWADDSNKDNIRPDKVTVHLLADDKDTGKSVTLNADNNWKGSFTDLDKGPTYLVKEDSVTDYATNIDKIDDTDFTITNTHTPKTPGTPTDDKTSLHVSKVWDDNNNQDNIRPNEVTVHLLKNGIISGNSVSLNSQNNWSYTWSNLDKNNNYTVQEDAVAGYVTNQNTNNQNIIITNTHTPKNPGNPYNPGNPDNPATPFNPNNPFVPSTPGTSYNKLPQTGSKITNIAYTIVGFIILALISTSIFKKIIN